MQTNKNKGFTLVEMVVVLVIIGILATVGVVSLTGYLTKGKEQSCTVVVNTLKSSYDSVYLQYKLSGKDSGETTVSCFSEEIREALDSIEKESATMSGGSSGPITITGLCPDGGVITAIRSFNGDINLSCDKHGLIVNADPTRAVGQGADFSAGMNAWLAANGGAFGSNTSGHSKGDFFGEYYQTHDAIQVPAEYQLALKEQGLNKTLVNPEKTPMYWWTYPVTDTKGNVLYTVTYANTQSNKAYWTDGNRGKMNAGYIVIVNGKTYVRANSGKTVEPGNQNNIYKTEADLEAALIANGYFVAK